MFFKIFLEHPFFLHETHLFQSRGFAFFLRSKKAPLYSFTVLQFYSYFFDALFALKKVKKIITVR